MRWIQSPERFLGAEQQAARSASITEWSGAASEIIGVLRLLLPGGHPRLGARGGKHGCGAAGPRRPDAGAGQEQGVLRGKDRDNPIGEENPRPK
jgi:hypothetical protein